MPVSFEKNTMIAAMGTSTATLLSTPHPMGSLNRVAVNMTIESIVSQSGGTPELDLHVEGSNDGLEFLPISGIEIAGANAAQTYQCDGDMPYAFLRLSYTLDPKGAGTELVFFTFDVTANLTHS